MWRRARCGTDYTLRWDGKLYQIERQAIVSGLRGANVRVEQRLDGSLAVRYGERYLPVEECAAAEQAESRSPVKAAKTRRAGGRGSDWNKNFDLKKAPKIWQAAQGIGSPTRRGMMSDELDPEGVARRQSSPYTGKLSARPAGKPGDFFIVKENLRRSLPRHSFSAAATNHTEAPSMRFPRHGGIYRSDVVSKSKPNPGAGPCRLPLVGPEPR